PDKHADVVVQCRLQSRHAVALVGGDFQYRIAELAVGGQQALHVRRVIGIQQVGLVEQQQRMDAGLFGGDQIAVDQVGVRVRQRGEDDDNLVDVGSHWLELPAAIRTAQLGVTRQLGDNHAVALIAGAPDYAIAGYQGRQVGAQVAAV